MKKAFTLIELLAVIIILAIVALIATPIILDVVNDAKDSAAKSEASMIVSGVNNYCAVAAMKEQLDGTTSICNDSVTAEKVKTMVDLGNAKVNSVTYTDGKVTSLVVESNGRTVTYDGSSYLIGAVYYAFGKPTTSSTTDYQSVITESGSNAFVKLVGEQLSICVYKNQTLECFENNNYTEESEHIKNVFADSCEFDSSYVGCGDVNFYCHVRSDGYVLCSDLDSGHSCDVDVNGHVYCE